MLTLIRRPDQIIKIGENIEVTVVKVSSNGTVRLGVSAPKDTAITRQEESLNRKKEESE